jgi:hypothetical protein
MQYFLKTEHFAYPKNNLETAVKEALKEFDRFIFPPKQLPVVISSLTNVIDSLNKQYKRCTPIKMQWTTDMRHITIAEAFKTIDDHDRILYFNGYNSPVLRIMLGKEISDL